MAEVNAGAPRRKKPDAIESLARKPGCLVELVNAILPQPGEANQKAAAKRDERCKLRYSPCYTSILLPLREDEPALGLFEDGRWDRQQHCTVYSTYCRDNCGVTGG